MAAAMSVRPILLVLQIFYAHECFSRLTLCLVSSREANKSNFNMITLKKSNFCFLNDVIIKQNVLLWQNLCLRVILEFIILLVFLIQLQTHKSIWITEGHSGRLKLANRHTKVLYVSNIKQFMSSMNGHGSL